MTFALPLLAIALTAVLGRLAWRARRRAGAGRRGFVTLHADGRSWLRGERLAEADDFLRLQAVIVSGHPGRQVGRLTLGQDEAARVVYLKREGQIRWTTRLANFLAGFGWVSRSVREAGLLEALERDGLPAPRWLATGEDSDGRAFLLVEEVPGAVPLTTLLTRLEHPRERRQLAARLGEALAKLHEAGFFHRDLYAKHVLVRPHDQGVILLDWQRAWRGAWITLASRVRDLAALHATIGDGLATSRERLALLCAYVAHTSSHKRRRLLRQLVVQVDRQARRLRQKRHIREKRQLPTSEQQAWICLDGDGFCITPELAEMSVGRPLDWLRLDAQPAMPGPVSRRWLRLAGRRQVLLERRRDRVSVNEFFRHWVLGRPIISPEQRRATLLWRLERHGVPAPRVLAAGRGRRQFGWQDSFVLCEPPPDTVRLSVWLGRAADSRRTVPRQVGRLLARMHEACCYLEESALAALAVQPGDGEPELVLESVEGVTPSRRPSPCRASRDVKRVQAFLIEQGCGGDDVRAMEEGYAELTAPAPAVASTAADRAASGTEPANVGKPPSFWQRLTRGWRRIQQRPDWPGYAGSDWPERIMQSAVTDDFHAKQGRSTGRWRVPPLSGQGPPLVVYLKRHYVLPFWQGLLATLWPRGNWSPAMMEYEHLEWARQQGVPVPATVAAGEFIGPWGKLQSFLAVEELTGMLALHQAIPLASTKMPPNVFRRWKRGLVAEMARLSRLLHDRHHFHKDLYLCHFFVHESDLDKPPGEELSAWRGRVHLIDLHRLTHHPWAWWVWLLKDLAQLLYSSNVAGVDVRDQVAFWMHYRGPGAQRWSSRWLRRLVLIKWRRYDRHNQRRKRRMELARSASEV